MRCDEIGDCGASQQTAARRPLKLELLRRDKPTKAEHTALTFEVDDIDREVAELEGRGVRFEDYDLPGLRTERHIAKMDGERAAWFKDTEGNILCIHQRVARG